MLRQTILGGNCALSALRFLIVLLALVPVAAACATLRHAGVIQPAPCDWSPGACQWHWLTCAATCERTAAGVYLGSPEDEERPLGRALRSSEVCAKYWPRFARSCWDVEGVSLEQATCIDYAEGWCDGAIGECLPRPPRCGGAGAK